MDPSVDLLPRFTCLHRCSTLVRLALSLSHYPQHRRTPCIISLDYLRHLGSLLYHSSSPCHARLRHSRGAQTDRCVYPTSHLISQATQAMIFTLHRCLHTRPGSQFSCTTPGGQQRGSAPRASARTSSVSSASSLRPCLRSCSGYPPSQPVFSSRSCSLPRHRY